MIRAVSFDLGQTLVEFDDTLLLAQAQARGLLLTLERLPSIKSDAWNAYNSAKAMGMTGFDAWAAFVRYLLQGSELRDRVTSQRASAEQLERFLEYLWSEQPRNNLWRKPIPGMLDLLEDLYERGTKLGVLTNSEGRARELVDELGFGAFVDVVVDSGVEGVEKPDPRIFAKLAERLDCDYSELVHVGDSYEADVLGALRVGATPIWFVPEISSALPPTVRWCRDARELSAALGAL